MSNITNAKKKSCDGARPSPSAALPPVQDQPHQGPVASIGAEPDKEPLPPQDKETIVAWFASNPEMLEYFLSCMDVTHDALDSGLIPDGDFPDDDSCEWRGTLEHVNLRDPLFWELPAGVDIDVDLSVIQSSDWTILDDEVVGLEQDPLCDG